MTVWLGPRFWFAGYFVIMATVPLTKCLGGFVQHFAPIYYRLSPGLLQIIHGRMGRDSLYVAESINLAKAWTMICFDKGIVQIAVRPPFEETHRIPLDAIAEPVRFAQSLVWAALLDAEKRESMLAPDSLLG
jgi:hypothetical protein